MAPELKSTAGGVPARGEECGPIEAPIVGAVLLSGDDLDSKRTIDSSSRPTLAVVTPGDFTMADHFAFVARAA